MLDPHFPISFQSVAQNLWPYGFVFIRWIAFSILVPGFGDGFIPARMRILLALGISTCMTPFLLLQNLLPQEMTIPLILGEVLVGLFLGFLPRIAMEMLQVTGEIMSQQSALSNVFVQIGAIGKSLISAVISLFFLTFIFATDLHLFFLRGVYNSYLILQPDKGLFLSDMLTVIIKTVSQGFSIAVQISSPFIVFGVLFYTALGLLSRLIPHIQVFFISQPLGILVTFILFLASLGTMSVVFLEFFQNVLTQFVPN